MSEWRPARFEVGDLVATALYGRAKILTFYRDRNLGWAYSLQLLDRNERFEGSHIALVESALTPVSAIDQLAELVG